MAEQIGRVLNDRYRLVTPIGSGASAMVFRADDIALRRPVAVKLLHAALSSDQKFVERFKDEAQRTAGLNHRHLLAVYDWGVDDGPFIVTEYLAGGTLQAMLDQGTRLSPGQALLVGLQAARGLEHAHRRGLVHRDIKPSNILFDEFGELRVADFGLARALAQSSVTEPVGSVVGTARYAAPEQAQTSTIDERADVYSLALVLSEAVTGRVPLTADTTVGTMMNRVNSAVPVAPELGPLREVLLAAGQIEAEDRPDAGALAQGLLEAAESLQRPLPLALAGVTELVPDVTEPTDHGTRPGSTASASPHGAVAPVIPIASVDRRASASPDQFDEGDEWQVTNAPAPRFSPGESGDPFATSVPTSNPAAGGPVSNDVLLGALSGSPGSQPIAPGSSRFTPPPPPEVNGGPGRDHQPPLVSGVAAARSSADSEDTESSSVVLTVVGFAAIALIALGGWFGFGRTTNRSHVVPDVIGIGVSELPILIDDYRWDVVQLENRVAGATAGEIVAQIPQPGADLAEGQEFRVTVSLGEPTAVIPPLAGLAEAELAAQLRIAGFRVGELTFESSEDILAGQAIRDGSASRQAPLGSAVPIVLSSGPVPRQLPVGLVGEQNEVVTSALTETRMNVVVIGEFDNQIPEGVVMSVDPPEGSEQPVGTEVRVVVSLGPEIGVVPDLEGLEVDEATEILNDAGFCVGELDGSPDTEVLATDPPAGDEARLDECIRVITRLNS